MLEAKSLSYSISGKAIVENISIKITPGELLVIVGSNGAGKSTLLKLLSSEIDSYKGQVLMNGTDIKDISLNQQAKSRAVLPQNASLSFPFKVSEVVMMGRTPYKSSGHKKDTVIVNEVLNAVGSAHLRNRTYTTLSGGERQRVQLARVLAQIWENTSNQHRYLLLDEPTSALDLAHQHNTLNIARNFAHKEGVGVLAVLHDLNLAALYADKIAMMKNGKVLEIGTSTSVLNAPLIQEVFDIEVDVVPHPAHESCPLVIAYAHQ